MDRKLSSTHITYMALMAALNVVFVLVANYVPIISLFLMFILPMASFFIILKCPLKYYPIYLIATLSLSLIASLNQLETTLFYILPSLIIGFVFGLLYKAAIPKLITIIFSSYVQLGLLYLMIVLINRLFETDFILTVLTLLKLDAFTYGKVMMPIILLAISLAQTAMLFLIIDEQFAKIIRIDRQSNWEKITAIGALIINIISIVLIWVWPLGSYLLLAPLLMMMGVILVDFFTFARKYYLIMAGLWFIVALFIFAIIYPRLPSFSGLALINLFPFMIILLKIIFLYLPNHQLRHKIEPGD